MKTTTHDYFLKYTPIVSTVYSVYELIKDNPFNSSHFVSGITGQYLALLVKELDVFNRRTVCLFGFSLGTLFTFTALATLYEMDFPLVISDVVLMGSVVDVRTFYDNLYKIIGSRGVVQGQIYVYYTHRDKTLDYMFRAAKFGDEYPLGVAALDYSEMAKSLQENDAVFSNESLEDLESYCKKKVININVGNIVYAHMDYRNKITKILKLIDVASTDSYLIDRMEHV